MSPSSPPNQDLHLGIDLGTQGLSALLIDGLGRQVGIASEPLRLLDGLPTGHREQHPSDWIGALRAVCRSLGARGFDLARVASIGVSGQQHGLVVLDRDGAVIRPAKLWNDVSAAPQCKAIVAELGGASRLFERTGNALPPGFTAGKLHWLSECEPANFARVAHVLLPHDYLNHWLTGDFTCEAGDASGTGWFDVRARRVDAEVLRAVGPDLTDKLPRLVAAGEIAGRLQATAARELGLREGTLVAAGGGDNMLAAIGAGAVEPGIAVMSLGTSGTVFAHADRPICDPDGEIAAFCASGDDRGWLPLGCTMNATVASETMRALFGLELDAFEAVLHGARPGADGLVCLPYFTGERAPDLPRATGTLLGMTPHNTTVPNILRAAVEGATFALVRLLDRLIELGLPLCEVRLTGGGSRSATWCSIVAAAIGDRLPVRVGASDDSAALGAAILAAWTAQRASKPSLTLAQFRRGLALDHDLRSLDVDRAAAAVYAHCRSDFATALQTLTPWFER